MQTRFPGKAAGAVCLLLLALNPARVVLAQDTTSQSQSLGDLTSFRTIVVDTIAIVDTGNLPRAKTRINDLEAQWDKAEAKLRPRNPEQWGIIDKAIDAALTQLRINHPQASASKDSLQKLLAILDRPSEHTNVTTGSPAIDLSKKLSVTAILDVIEKSQAGAVVLDVSFEPKDGQPLYAIRTYANGKVLDGVLDATTGAVVDQGAAVDESALDAEDRVEVKALKGAKMTLRQAVALAEKATGGVALNAGLEMVGGRALWEILIQNTTPPRQIHIDPMTGKII